MARDCPGTWSGTPACDGGLAACGPPACFAAPATVGGEGLVGRVGPAAGLEGAVRITTGNPEKEYWAAAGDTQANNTGNAKAAEVNRTQQAPKPPSQTGVPLSVPGARAIPGMPR